MNPQKLLWLKNRVKRRQLFVSYVKSYRGCSKCGEKDPIVLDFHHTDDNKVDNVSRMLSRRGLSVIIQEMEKCEVLCANCHRRATHQNTEEKYDQSM